MTDDVRIATGLRRHRKTKRLRRLLGTDGCWALVCLFLWAGEERWTGDLSGLSDADIEEEADWEGDPGALIAALIEVGFLKGAENRRKIHQWEEHNPYASTKGVRIAKAKTAANARWNKTPEAAPPLGDDAPSMPEACSTHADSNALGQCPPAPTPTKALSVDASTHAERTLSARAPNSEAWTAFEAHQRQLGKWTVARSTIARAQLRAIADAGGNPDDVLRWATIRGLADLADCHRRMRSDAEREQQPRAAGPPGVPQMSRTRASIEALESMRLPENPPNDHADLDAQRTPDRAPKAALPAAR